MLVLCCASGRSEAQTMAALQGRVVDESGGVIRGADIVVHDDSTGFVASVLTDPDGIYHVAAVPGGTYTITAKAAGFRTEVVEALHVDVGRPVVRNFLLKVGDQTETVVVAAEVPL